MKENGQDRPAGAPADSSAENTSTNEFRRWIPIVLLVAVMAIGYAEGWYKYLSLANLIRERQDLTEFVDAYLLLALAAYVAIYAVSVALSFPGASFLTIAGGFLFGWLTAGLATIFAATLGATIVFLAARSSLGTTLKARAGPFLSRLSSGFRENAMSYLLFLRLTPVFPFWLVNIAPAIFHVPVGTYVFSTLVGIIPGTFAFAFIGSGLDSVIAAQEAANPGCAAAGSCEVDVGAFVTPELLAALFVLGFASLIPVVLKRLRKKSTTG
ncbi:TVP38/TMEM64 family protein [Roseibium aggregatum]|uniref:TVP38/TMEM64 family membrane protein n=1 Tax=Roseibium aggregatum TaxID=187304 RepID=A0A926P0U4_9HYPH|nr:VTT domain-containing protein [Roseibium aggregatum]MBD1544721.1 TVP38/TMEM64 family protein [Roseibium aggregatum]